MKHHPRSPSIPAVGLVAATLLGLTLAWGQERPAAGSRPANLAGKAAPTRDVPYAATTNPAQRLDIYLPKNAPGPLPVIVWVHGGAWSSGSKFPCPAGNFVNRGYAVVSVEYRFAQEAIFPAQIQDCKAAIRFLRANHEKYGLDPDRIGAWGSSAGGHLVALLGTAGDSKELEGDGPNKEFSSRVQCVVDFYGPTDMLQISNLPSRIQHATVNSPEARLLGGLIEQRKDLARAANPIIYITKDAPPFLIMHGDKDDLVPFNQSELLEAALKQAGTEVTLYKVVGGGHGGWREPKVQPMVEEFFDKHLKNTSTSRPVDRSE
jgi:acetyl esterase/lipase